MTPSSRSKDQALQQNLSASLQQYLLGKSYRPQSSKELIERLSIPPQHQKMFRAILRDLVKDGFLSIKQKLYYVEAGRREVVRGTLRVHPRGFGFLQADNSAKYPQDVFVPKQLTKNAVDGDVVEVLVDQESTSDKGPEGRVITILERARTHIAGIVLKSLDNGDFQIYVPLLGREQMVRMSDPEDFELRVGDRIIMKVLDWGDRKSETLCSYTHFIGPISDASADIPAAIEEFNIREDFSAPIREEAAAFGSRVPQAEIKNREDLRHLETFTIDPKTAKDFDDALSLEKDGKGNYHLWVHIADVTHYVRSGTALDEEARLRCNSTYFPGQCVPMLPPQLADNLCSLRANVNRLAASVWMKLDSKGRLLDYRVTRSVIKSQKRFSYESAKAVLDGEAESKHAPTLHLMVELCEKLKRLRSERGSVEFALPELIVKVDEEGRPLGTEKVEYDITHQMVEEFMLKANETVATHLSKLKKPTTYRVHEDPAEDNISDFVTLVRSFGFRIPNKPEPQDIQALFDEVKEYGYYQYLATCYIRCMKLAEYSPDNVGHFGLSLEHYCHFTSPIRRYPDLIVHRILFGESLSVEDLHRISSLCSEQERISARAEQNVKLLKKLRLLDQWKAKDPFAQYEAVVTRVKPFGLFFELKDLMVEGYIHVSQLSQDYYRFNEERQRLEGRYSEGTYAAGQPVTVILNSVDLILLETQWELVGAEEGRPQSRDRGRRRKGRRQGRGRR